MNRIKFLREEFNYTQQDLADKLNSSKSVIGLYENEMRKPSMEILIKLSEIFNCSIDYLLGISDIRKPEDIKIEKELLSIGLSKKDYSPPTKEQQEKIEEYARFVLKDNLKNKED